MKCEYCGLKASRKTACGMDLCDPCFRLHEMGCTRCYGKTIVAEKHAGSLSKQKKCG